MCFSAKLKCFSCTIPKCNSIFICISRPLCHTSTTTTRSWFYVSFSNRITGLFQVTWTDELSRINVMCNYYSIVRFCTLHLKIGTDYDHIIQKVIRRNSKRDFTKKKRRKTFYAFLHTSLNKIFHQKAKEFVPESNMLSYQAYQKGQLHLIILQKSC